MRLPALFASVALAFTALPAAFACDPIIAGNMTTLEHDLFAWNTTMEAYLQGDVTQTEEALKVSTQLSLSINMTAMSLVESTMTLHHKDSKKLIALYDTLEADVTSITAKLTEKTEVLMDVQVIGFLDEALPSVEYASDFLADTLAGKSSASFTEHIKQVAASVDSSIEGVLESVHAHDASPAPPKDDAQQTNMTASAQGDGKSSVKASTDGGELKADAKSKGEGAANVETDGNEEKVHASSTGDSSVSMSGSGDAQMSGSSKSSSHASASINHSNKERRAEPEDIALVRRADPWETPLHPHSSGASDGTDADEKDRRSAADDVIYARRVNAGARPPAVWPPQDPPSPIKPGQGGKMKRRSEVENQLDRRAKPLRRPKVEPIRPGRKEEPITGDLRASNGGRKEKRSEAQDFVYVRRDEPNESGIIARRAQQGDKSPPKFPSISKQPGH